MLKTDQAFLGALRVLAQRNFQSMQDFLLHHADFYSIDIVTQGFDLTVRADEHGKPYAALRHYIARTKGTKNNSPAG